jgi:Domain of unknown function (DUF932)
MSGRLIAHCGAEYIDREGLKDLETPPATDTWTPIPHYDLVVALDGQLKARGISIIKEQFAVQKAKLFGVIDTDFQVTEEGGAAIGIRTANDKSLALQLAIGYRIFICDNMAFHGDLIALRRKHTAHLDLHKEFAEGIGRYVREYPKLKENINWWKERVVSKERGKQLIYDIFSQRLVPLRLFHPAVRDWEATENKTMWTIQNAVSNHIKTLKPAPAFTSTLKLSRFFEKVG